MMITFSDGIAVLRGFGVFALCEVVEGREKNQGWLASVARGENLGVPGQF